MVDLLGMLTIRLATFKLKRLGGGEMNNTKGTETKAYDLLYSHLMSNIKDPQADQKLYYFRLLLEKYNEERKENERLRGVIRWINKN